MPRMADDTTRFRITVLPEGWHFDAAPAQTVLEAARAAGHRLVSSCRNGTCRACLSRIVDGQIAYRIEWPGLSADEKRDGFTLPCVAEPRSDLVIERVG
jgi:ferredoxin